MYVRALLLVLLAALSGAAPAGDDLLLPEARTAAPIDGPFTRVTIRADGAIEHDGRPIHEALPGSAPALVEPLRTFKAAEPTGLALVAGDRRVDFRAVRAVLAAARDVDIREVGLLAAPDTTPPRALRVVQRVVAGDPLTFPDGPRLPQLAIHLRADALIFMRKVETHVVLPRVGGALDTVGLAHLLAEDKRLHPAGGFVIINTDDGVAYADTFGVLDLTRAQGYPRTLLAGGPPSHGPGSSAEPTPPLVGVVEAPVEVSLRPDGGVDVRGADGALDLIRADSIDAYEAHCDAGTCDIVLRTSTRRVALGSRPRDVPVPHYLFGKLVHAYAGRLELREPTRTGLLSPLVALPGGDRPAAEGTKLDGNFGDPILLGSLDKVLIDNVMKANMGQLRACYNAQLARNAVARGKLTMKFIIAADGSVSSAVADGNELDEEMGACVAAALRTYVFPKPKGGGIVIVRYPFVFTPG